MLLVDKYRPTSLQSLSYHDNITQQLSELCESGDIPHCLFYGPSGAGKKTRLAAVLREMYGPGVEKIKVETKVVETASAKKLEIQVLSSNYHIEVTPSDLGNQDRIVIQGLIKELAKTAQVDQHAKHKFKVVVINEADSLSRNAQSALRRTMEKYMRNFRLLLCCESASKIIAPIRSRCLMIRVPSPDNKQITDILLNVGQREGIKIPDHICQRIVAKANGNLRKSLLILEAMKMQQYPFVENQVIPTPDWELVIEEMSTMMLQDQSPKCLLQLRDRFYRLLANCIPASIILKTLTKKLLVSLPSSMKQEVISSAAEYEHRMNMGSKEIFHLEAFAAKLLNLYNQFQLRSL